MRQLPLCYLLQLIIILVGRCLALNHSFTINMMVLLPFDPGSPWKNEFQLSYAKVEPVLEAAQTELRRRQLLPGVKLNQISKNSNCSDTDGPNQAVEVYCKSDVNVIFGPVCPYALATVALLTWSWQTSSQIGIPILTTTGMTDEMDDKKNYKLLTRMNGSYKLLAKAFKIFIGEFQWKHYAYYLHDKRDPTIGKSECNFQLRTFKVGKQESILFDEYKINATNHTDNLIRLSMAANIIILCASPRTVREIMLAAADLGMTSSGRYLFINVDVSTGSHNDRPWLLPNDTESNNQKARLAYRAQKTISLRRSSRTKEFEKSVKKLAEQKTGQEYQMNNFISSFYDAVLLYGLALNETLEAGENHKNGSVLIKRMWNRTFQGISSVSIDANGDRFSDYSFLDMNPNTERFLEVAYYSGKKDKLIKSGLWHWVDGEPPIDTPVCGWDRSKCPEQGLEPWAWSLIALVVVTLIFAIISFFIYRHYRMEAELAAMSWRIRWEELSGEDRRKERSKHMRDGTPGGWIISDPDQLNPLLQRADSRISLTKSAGSEETLGNFTQQIFTKTASYKGTVVAIKKLAISKPKIEINRKLLIELKRMKDLQYDHVTRFVGACIDAPHYCVVTEYCPKGSLQDILENESIELDKMMLYSLIHDIVKGMDFIHSNSDIRSHGNLKSSNCVVDSRFVLKITDFGLHYLHELEEVAEDEGEESHTFWKKKLWTAPELLRLDSEHREGTSKADVYSFAITLHEMLYRQGVFYLNNDSLSPREIVENLKEDGLNPLRPSLVHQNICDAVVEKLMVRCWAENPNDRPDFVGIRKIFRSLNREYETSNIVDNLLKRMELYANNLEELVEERTSDYVEEKQKVEELLHQLLPRSVAATLLRGDSVKAEAFSEVTIYFSDIVGFTSLSSESTPMQVVTLLNDLYTCFDATIEAFGVYKVETIKDQYMVVAGLPERVGDRHASEIARMALALLNRVQTFRIRHRPNDQLKLQIGIHSGPVCAGVVGSRMPRYCLFGDTVNTASRMESNGLPRKIHVSAATKEILDREPGFVLDLRGEVEMKGKGKQTTYWLLSYDDQTSATGSQSQTYLNRL